MVFCLVLLLIVVWSLNGTAQRFDNFAAGKGDDIMDDSDNIDTDRASDPYYGDYSWHKNSNINTKNY